MTEKEQLINLINQYMEDSISDENLIILKDSLKNKTDEDLLEMWDDLSFMASAKQESVSDADHLFQRIISDDRIQYDPAKDTKIFKISPVIKRILIVASAVCVFILLKFALDSNFRSYLFDTEGGGAGSVSAIVPGGNKARIVLADGSQINLEALKNDTTIYLEGYSVYKNDEGSITYAVNSDNISRSDIYNTIITPKGGEFNLIMSDGTEVFINASSSLRYPVNFREDRRVVELTGEAYFDVNKKNQGNKNIPFIVKTEQQTLEVLGTSFNLNSYGNTIQTTLVEGSVKLSFGNDQSHILRPNEQAVFERETKKMEINTVDPFYVIAWKNGSFAYENASIYEVMESIARWYDIDVVFKDELRHKRFTGTISRFEDITKLLKTVEFTGSVKFKIEGRRILVMK